MPTIKVTFAKIASNPSAHSWSQTYSAGNFAALIALSNKEKDGENTLQTIGSQIVSALESEYFTLEEKNLTTIKPAIEMAIAHIPPDVEATVIVTTVINTILYAFLYGMGKVLIKRGTDTGVLLERQALAIDTGVSTKENLTAASGYLQNGDCIIMATEAFFSHIPKDILLEQINSGNVEELAETFMTKLHRKKDGAACGILFSFMSDAAPSSLPPDALTPLTEELPAETAAEAFPSSLPPKLPLSTLKVMSLGRKRVVLIAIAVLIILVIIINIVTSIQKQKQKQEITKFNNALAIAEGKYTEGANLLALNKGEARDDFQQAIVLVTPFQTMFSPSSQEGITITSFLKKAQNGLVSAKADNQISGTPAPKSASILLEAEMKNPSGLYFTQDNTHIYFADNQSVSSLSKSDATIKTIIKSSGDWSEIGGLGTYIGNMYVLDKKTTLIKYIQSSGGFGKNDYFTGAKIDLSHTVSMTIDGSIYILFDDGSIRKYTKGKPDTFSLSGLEKPLSHATRLFTSSDQNNLYILDNGNSRIAIVNKDGAYQAEYSAALLAKAIDFDVDEKDKKIYVLSDNKIWEIDIK